MKYTVPDYFPEFRCIAAECPATCCAGWQIVIDDQSLKKYKNIKTPFGNRLMNSIDWEEKVFYQYGKRCAFLNEENLCDIYTEAGPQMLCRTCKRYPRHIEEFDNERELSLSVSCPEAARILLGKTEKVTFLEKENDKTEPEDENFDLFLYSELQECRKVILEILQNREQSIAYRMAKVLVLVHDIQNRIQAGRIFEIQDIVKRYQHEGADEKLSSRFSEYQMRDEKDHRILFSLLRELEVLDASWPEQLTAYETCLFSDLDLSYIDKKRKAFSIWAEHTGKGRCSNPYVIVTEPKWREVESEQLLVYFIYTYFCGGIYDGDILAKTKMAIVATLILRDMEVAWQISHEELISLQDRAKIVWKFSRELEHSDPNLNKMEELLGEKGTLDYKKLLSLIFA